MSKEGLSAEIKLTIDRKGWDDIREAAKWFRQFADGLEAMGEVEGYEIEYVNRGSGLPILVLDITVPSPLAALTKEL